MPRGDRTGPLRMGPLTDQGRGYCTGFPVGRFMNQRPAAALANRFFPPWFRRGASYWSNVGPRGFGYNPSYAPLRRRPLGGVGGFCGGGGGRAPGRGGRRWW